MTQDSLFGKTNASMSDLNSHSLICDSSKGCKWQSENSSGRSQGLSHVIMKHVNMEATSLPAFGRKLWIFLAHPPSLLWSFLEDIRRSFTAITYQWMWVHWLAFPHSYPLSTFSLSTGSCGFSPQVWYTFYINRRLSRNLHIAFCHCSVHLSHHHSISCSQRCSSCPI